MTQGEMPTAAERRLDGDNGSIRSVMATIHNLMTPPVQKRRGIGLARNDDESDT